RRLAPLAGRARRRHHCRRARLRVPGGADRDARRAAPGPRRGGAWSRGARGAAAAGSRDRAGSDVRAVAGNLAKSTVTRLLRIALEIARGVFGASRVELSQLQVLPSPTAVRRAMARGLTRV